jgi:hypothetical protein
MGELRYFGENLIALGSESLKERYLGLDNWNQTRSRLNHPERKLPKTAP